MPGDPGIHLGPEIQSHVGLGPVVGSHFLIDEKKIDFKLFSIFILETYLPFLCNKTLQANYFQTVSPKSINKIRGLGHLKRHKILQKLVGNAIE